MRMSFVRVFVVILCFMSVGKISFGQDPEFSQFYANPVYLNPAFAGSHGCPRISMNFRDQWPSLSGTFLTTTISYDQYFKNISGGIGVLLTNDMAGKGTLNTTTGSLIYSYHLQVSRKFRMMFAAQATWNQKFLDWSKLAFGDQFDPKRGNIYRTSDYPPQSQQLNSNSSLYTKGYFDASVGMLGYTKNFYFGFVAKHLNKPNESLLLSTTSRLPMRFTAHVGAQIPLGRKSKYSSQTTISPNIIYSFQNYFQQLNIGLYVKHSVFVGGVWWREGDAFITMVGIDTGIFRLGYSYDVTISKLTNASGGAHEVSMGFNFNCKKKKKPFKIIDCPSF
jgi:type IX secretion system PorP/SprF family membrane protein